MTLSHPPAASWAELSKNDGSTWRLDWHTQRDFPDRDIHTWEPVVFAASDVQAAIAEAERRIESTGATATTRLALQGAIAAWSLTWPASPGSPAT